jgi:tRNA A-37 threonylcarbamoyl transferase component Bud32
VTFPPLTVPQIFGGRYAVERPLGSGATATVYLCRDRQTMNAVAVKVLHLDLAESMGAERFLREIRLTSGLDHPSILPVIDSGAEGSQLYCVLPYMEGGTLRDLLREKKQLGITEAVEIAKTIAIAVAYANDNGLIHRDIKPENILFHQGKAYLGDFGIARALFATAGQLTTTTTGVIRGTPAYMSPEQASGERTYDGRSDIYSLGCVVYEMIRGMPPFVGPTTQSVMAQRFSTVPREMRAYRSSVSPAMERVVQKAMMPVPADRYMTAREFADALEAAAKVPPTRAFSRRGIMIGVAAAALLVAAGALANRLGVGAATTDVRPDTTQLVVLPFERDAATESLGSIDPFIYEAFSAWRGLTVIEPFQVRDAVARKGTVSGVERDRSVAVALGAGRFVRGSVVSLPGGAGWRIFGWLHEVRGKSDTMLYNASITIKPSDLATIGSHYASLASMLLLRGSDSSSSSSSLVVSTTSLPAMQFFARGIGAVNEWDFPTADSLFASAVVLDPKYGRAYLWQAQVRFWQRAGPDAWAPLAQKALVDTTRQPQRDIRLARALAALGAKDYDAACREYDGLRQKNAADFAAWFGLGRCRDLDYRIVRDAESPTGWSYRSSYSDAVDAYQRAFEVLSLSHRSLERGAFEPLRDLLFMRPSKLQATVLPPNEAGSFVGRLDWENGKPILRPIPLALTAAGDPAAVPAGLRQAVASQQKLFGKIAAAWSAALPTSAGAKEGVAVALEMRGDRAALDTLRIARSLATDPDAQLRLAASDVILRLKFANPADSNQFRIIQRLADSLLTENPRPSARGATSLIPLAVLTGHCHAAASLLQQTPYSNTRGVSRDALGAADALTVSTLLGCADDPSREVQGLQRRVETSAADPSAVVNLLARAVQSMAGSDTALTSSFARTGGYLLKAQSFANDGKRDSVRALLTRLAAARVRTGYDDISPDAVYLESRVLLFVGDTAMAKESLHRVLERLPFLTPGMLARPVEMAGFLRCIELLDRIAPATDVSGWERGRRILWSFADPMLLKNRR